MGYGVIDSDTRRHELVALGVIGAAKSIGLPERLRRIADQLAAVLDKYAPQYCSIEEAFYSRNVKTALRLGQVRGVAMVEALRAGVEVVEYPPATIKQALVGYGRAEKEQVADMVKLLLRLPARPQPHDAADALAAAICHVHTAGTTASMARRSY
jgi:crossover junction endodeoxyribonuclease RuvC